MAAAIAAAKEGADVKILEKNPRIGKKILSTGNGRCNYSNIHADKSAYTQEFCSYVVEKITPKYIEIFFKELGMLSAVEDGRMYPKSMQASAVLNILRTEIKRLGVDVITEFDAEKISKTKDGFCVFSKDGRKVFADAVIMSTGGCAAPKTGSDGTGYKILKQLGHSITMLKPALCRVKTDKGIQGVRQYGEVYLDNGIRRAGEIQFAKDALSGIPVFGLARYVNRGDSIYIDLMPEMTENEVYEYLKDRKCDVLENYLVGILNKSLGQLLMKECGFEPLSRSASSLNDCDVRKIAKTLKMWKFIAGKPESWDNAQVTSGGVDVTEVDEKTMQSKLIPGLYITGELLDVDADCGGYNLHWAWASGLTAGSEAARCTK